MNRWTGSAVSTALLLCGLLAGGGLPAPGPAEALSVQEAILSAKPAVALVSAEVSADVTMDCGQGPITVQPAPFIEMGTAWFVDGRGYLITNAHVVDPAERMPPWVVRELREKAIEQGCVEPGLRARRLSRGERPDIEDRIRRAISPVTITLAPSRRITVLLSNGTILPAKVEKFSPPLMLDARGEPLPGSGRDLALLKVQEGVYPALPITTRVPNMGDSVHILGFPGVVLTNELLNQQVRLEASATNGLISGFKQDAIGQDVIQTDAPAAHGNSGGPAISAEATVLGVMTFVSLSPAGGSIVQGFNFLIPAKDIRTFLEGTPVRPGQSRFTAPWTDGLKAYFDERYATAVERFRETDQLLPGLVDVRRTLLDAEDKLEHPPPRPFPWAWVTAATVTLVSLSVYGGMGIRRWWRNRYRVVPAQVIGFMERGLDPVLLDVRIRGDYDTSPLTLPGAVRLEPERVTQEGFDPQVERQRLIVTFCTSPDERTSAAVTQALRRRGFRNVRILKGGLGGWTNARLPVEAKSHLPSIGLELYRNLTLGDIERRRFPAGAVIFNDGDDARGEAYVVHSGTVEIRKRFDGSERRLNTVREGELMGEMALFRKAPRSAAAVAVSDVELLVIRNERLEWLIRNRPQLTLEVLKSLSNHVVSADRERSEATTRQAAS
jgi:rhodanese-related sulfurtransferase